MKRFTLILLIIAQPLFAQQFNRGKNGSITDNENSGGIKSIASVKQIAQLTGQPSLNNTGHVNVYGTDLGSMFLHSDGKIYFLFGDTFGPPGNPGSIDWRSNTMAFSTDFIPSDGIIFDGWIIDSSSRAKALIEGNHDPNDGLGEVTKIPTAGWSIDNQQFMWYMSVKQWGTPGGWDVNYSEIAYSLDNGNSWLLSGTKQLENSNFIQVTVVKQSGYLLFWGIPAGRFGGVKLARVLLSKVLDQSAYQFYTGTGWSNKEGDGILIVDPPVGELSVLWNPYLQRWVMMYLNENNAVIEVREARDPTGPWSEPWEVVSAEDYPALYGAFMHKQYMENDGEIVYFLMSQFIPYNVFLMQVVFAKNVSEVIDDSLLTEKPKTYFLYQNHPNPFNSSTKIKYSVPKSSNIVINVFDILGNEIETLVNEEMIAGSYEVDYKSDELTSGIYFYKLQAGSFSHTKKMIVLK